MPNCYPVHRLSEFIRPPRQIGELLQKPKC